MEPNWRLGTGATPSLTAGLVDHGKIHVDIGRTNTNSSSGDIQRDKEHNISIGGDIMLILIKNERNFAQTKGSDWVRQGSPWFGIYGSSGSGRVVADSQRMIGARSNLTGSVARVSEGWGAPFDQLSSCQIIWTGRGQE